MSPVENRPGDHRAEEAPNTRLPVSLNGLDVPRSALA
jgi:hypothetical protein